MCFHTKEGSPGTIAPLDQISSFQLQACCAFSFVTIPSILGGVDAAAATRLACLLSAHSAQVAYACRCFGQAEDAVRAAIRYLLEAAAAGNKQKSGGVA